MKILSLNLWNINAPLVERMHNLEIFIKRNHPDVIAFQEVSRLPNGRLQVEDILQSNGYANIFYRLSGFWGSRDEGLMIASKKKMERIIDKSLPLAPNDMPRGLIGIRIIEGSDSGTVVVNTHLAYTLDNESGRRKQIQFILNELSTLSTTDKIIFCGDFNEDASVKNVYSIMLSNGFKDTFKDPSQPFSFADANKYVVPELWPNRRIDYIFERNIHNIVSHCVMCETDGYSLSSDHYGILAEEIGI